MPLNAVMVTGVTSETVNFTMVTVNYYVPFPPKSTCATKHAILTLFHYYLETLEKVHPYVHTHIRTYAHTYIRTYVHTHIRTYAHTYIRTYAHTYVHTHTTYNFNIHSYIHTHTHNIHITYTYTYIYLLEWFKELKYFIFGRHSIFFVPYDIKIQHKKFQVNITLFSTASSRPKFKRF